MLEAAKAQGGDLAEAAEALLAPGVGESDDLGEANGADRAWALEGGDPVAGQRVFQTVGDCQRCHGGGGGHGAGAGPDLAGVSKRGAPFVLESMLSPGAQIADGFGSVVVTRRDGSTVAGLLIATDARGVLLDVARDEPLRIDVGEIVSTTDPTTGMPPMGLALEPRALRDVIAYVMSL
jgi:quinoprotein glucose dehydrogenase